MDAPSTTRPKLSTSSTRPSSTLKRDSLIAELEKDPQLSSAKRQQRTKAFTSGLAHAHLERQLASAQATKMELETKLREREILVERLERDRRWFADREKGEKEERERERGEYERDKSKLEADLRSLRSSLSVLREEHADLLDTHQALAHSQKQSETSLQSRISTLASRSAQLQSALQDADRLAEERLTTLSTLHEQMEELSGQREDTKRREEEQNMGIVRQELQRQAGYLRELERTNAMMRGELNMLRERHASIEVLREEKRVLEKKAERMEEMREQVARLEAEVDAARREREVWAENTPSTAANTPVTLTETLSSLRLAHARLLEEHGATTAQLRSREAELLSAAEREAEAEARADRLESEVNTLCDKLARNDAQLRLVEREVGFQKAMVASYSLEQMHDQASGEGEEARNVDVPIAHLEGLLEEYKTTNGRLVRQLEEATDDQKARTSAELKAERTRVGNLENALSTAQSEVEAHLAIISSLREEAKGLEDKTKTLEDANEELEQTLHDLRGEMAGGRHVPPGVRVLSLKENPASEWAELTKKTMERVKGENEALLKRVWELERRVGELASRAEEGKKNEAGRQQQVEVESEELVPRASWEGVCREKEELEELVRQKEKRVLRLKQIYESKGAEFREAIAAILGVKLAFFPNGNVRVTSTYDLQTSFVFQPRKAGQQGARMQLIGQGEEAGPQDIPSLIEFWLEKEECVPGFLASVTLECYEYAKRKGMVSL